MMNKMEMSSLRPCAADTVSRSIRTIMVKMHAAEIGTSHASKSGTVSTAVAKILATNRAHFGWGGRIQEFHPSHKPRGMVSVAHINNIVATAKAIRLLRNSAGFLTNYLVGINRELRRRRGV
jgi:hypothetical protein